MKTAVFLMNLGGPRSREEVEPYLYELFSDPLVLSAPLGPLRRVLAKLISSRRWRSSAEKYDLVSGGQGRSPIVPGTIAQAEALRARLGPEFTTHVAMRYGHPNTGEAVAEALAAGAERAVALPLYPQFANATTTSSLRELRRAWPAGKPRPVEITRFGTHPGYVASAAACLAEGLAQLSGEHRARPLVVFSAHGLPMSQVRKGDPYPSEVEATARETAARAGVGEYQVTYQSRVGPTEWLGPDTAEWIAAHAKGRAVVAVPVAFVSEHLETLYDLDVLAKEAAARAGAVAYARAPAPGTRADFIAALAEIVQGALAAGEGGA